MSVKTNLLQNCKGYHVNTRLIPAQEDSWIFLVHLQRGAMHVQHGAMHLQRGSMHACNCMHTIAISQHVHVEDHACNLILAKCMWQRMHATF